MSPSKTVKILAEPPLLQPYISQIYLEGLDPIDVPPGAVVFIVGPNNGGKSTFLNEIQARVGHVSNTKWIAELKWELGTEQNWAAYVRKYLKDDPENSGYMREIGTGNRVAASEVLNFYRRQKANHHVFLIRHLDAQNRIGLANQISAPDVVDVKRTHPYHEFFFSKNLEEEFSKKIKTAFNHDFRINRTGSNVVGHLGKAPKGERLSVDYEFQILTEMIPVPSFGDGVRSYVGILLNSLADPRPVTIVDEPEAFLHPPQARRLGLEMASASKESGRQVFVATHSSDFIQGAISAKNPNTIFLYLDHSNKKRRIFSVDRNIVEDFSNKPFLSHTNALDALFYEQAIICEGEADIMFFRWAVEGSAINKRLQEAFWISSYGKAAIPGMMKDMLKLGIRVKAIFDLDVLLSLDILEKVCELIEIDFAKYKKSLQKLASSIKVPPAAEALQKIEDILGSLDVASDDEPSRLQAIRAIKKSAESLGKSWVLKSSGMRAMPKGQIYSEIDEFIKEIRRKGIIILEEGEIENYIPGINLHGQAWVRSALELGSLSDEVRASIVRQLKDGIV